jgi:hypothetical protein
VRTINCELGEREELIVRRRSSGAWEFAVLTAIVAAGCSEKQSESSRASIPGASAPSDPKTPQEVLAAEGCRIDVTDDEARAFADRFVAALRAKRHDEMKEMVDYQLLLKIALRGAPDKRDADGYREGFVQSIQERNGGPFNEAMTLNAEFRVLSVGRNARGQNVMIRVLGAEGPNYFNLEVVRARSGTPVVVDAFVYAAGEYLSDSIRAVYLISTGDASPFSTKLTVPETDKAFTTFDSMTTNLGKGRFREAIDDYRALPRVFQQTRMTLIVLLNAAKGISEAEYRSALGEIRKHHGDAAWANLMLIEDDLARNDFDGALRRIDRMEADVGDNSYANVMRAMVFSQKGDHQSALAAASRCIAVEPGLRDGHDVMLVAAGGAGRFELVRAELLVLERQFHRDLDRWADSDEAESFRQSPEYDRWKADRTKP